MGSKNGLQTNTQAYEIESVNVAFLLMLECWFTYISINNRDCQRKEQIYCLTDEYD